MKYALMSLTIGSELQVLKPSLFQLQQLERMGYEGPTPTVDEMYAFFQSKGLPMKNGTMSFRDMVKFAADNGFDGLDVMCFNFDVDPAEAKKAFEDYGITFASVGLVAPFTAAATEEQFAATMANTKDIISRAAEAGCESIMMMPSTYQPYEGATREQAYQLIVRALKELNAFCKEKKICMHTETLESLAIPLGSIGDMKRLFTDIPDLLYTHDTGNCLVAMENPVDFYEEFKDRVAYVHFKDFKYSDNDKGNMTSTGKHLEKVHLGDGLLDFKAQLKALKRDNYNGFISLEGTRPGSSILESAANALTYFKKLEAELDD